jgi:hypothetical protein
MASDTLSYIFGIIKYIKENISNNYYINNNNNYYNNNENNIIIKAVGSCVRSILRKEEYTDILLVISCSRIIDEFIRIIKVFDILDYNIDIIDYGNIDTTINIKHIGIIYNNKKYTIYISNSVYNYNLIKYLNNEFEFTCNNLEINFDGNISTRITHDRVKNHSSLIWTTSCIQDAIFGKFRVIVLDNMNIPDKIKEYNDLFQNMINLGFAFDRETNKNLTQYQFIELVSHTDVKKYDEQREISHSCCICREQYNDDPNKKTILVGCHHDFHIECIDKWVKTNKNSCPICRKILSYEF